MSVTPSTDYAGNTRRVRVHWEREVTPHTLPTTYVDYDPTGIYLIRTAPDGTKTTYTYPASSNLTKESVSRYLCLVPMPTAGEWYTQWGCDDGFKERKMFAVAPH